MPNVVKQILTWPVLEILSALVHRLLNPSGSVVFKMGRLRGGRKEHIWIDTRLTSNEAADPFSTQPSGPRPVGCFSSAAADRPL